MSSLLRGAFFALVEDSHSGHFSVPDDPFRAAGGEAGLIGREAFESSGGEVRVSGLFDDLDRLDLGAHVRRWSASEIRAAEGDVSQWMAAAQQFAARLQADGVGMSDEQWRVTSRAWAALLAAAERSTGAQSNEWLMRDLWLRASLLNSVGPRLDVPLLDEGPVLERALNAMPMTSEAAAELAPGWRDLEREQILELRTTRRLLAPARLVESLFVDHSRRGEYEAWRELAERLP
ncbi:hypothetical protein OG609_12425 [Streptomyces sp. NBC_01224]|uniref:hypothetical protein n=1 Tax=Streptomyces sp. NBC_01224 TaxID=2903783 RepID=UPI002E14ABC1|nr:hypothetical protein OG609_12425 [Streptomyces sp. NBC_01224]